MTIAEVCDHFMRELTNDNLWRSYSTKRAYKAYLKRWIVPHWGDVRLSEVRTMEVESWLRGCQWRRAAVRKSEMYFRSFSIMLADMNLSTETRSV